MGVWRCKVSLRYGIRNNVGLYRCRLCGGDVFLSVSRHFRPEGEHTIAVEDLFAGYFETVLERLIAELQIPAQGKTRAAYLKVKEPDPSNPQHSRDRQPHRRRVRSLR
jgi:hypothetical protein